jgi:hypothetical protein
MGRATSKKSEDGREQVSFFHAIHAMPHNPPGLAGNRQP